MDYFQYRNERLFAEETDLECVCREVQTPVYVYSKATFLEHLLRTRQSYLALDAMVCYSVKACGNINILRFLADHGSGFDIVSGGELHRVLAAGADPSKVVYAGVGKTDAEIVKALEAGIAFFNVESEAELANLAALAGNRGASCKRPRVALRVNPDVDPRTHAYTTTGKKGTKFGMDPPEIIRLFREYGREGSIDLCGLHMHLGSAGKTVGPYAEAIQKVLVLADRLKSDGFNIDALNIGGGYGADYVTATAPSAADYASAIVPLLTDRGLELYLEPGASIAANAAVLLTRVLYVKSAGGKKFIIVDAAMNDLIRPALYEAFHFIWPVSLPKGLVPSRRDKDPQIEGTEPVDIVGPVCEGADFIAKDRRIPPVKRGDLLAVFTAGAYGFSMSSNYNSRLRAPEVLVDGASFSVIRRRETYEDLVALERP